MEILLILLIGVPIFLVVYPLYLGSKVKHLETRLSQMESTISSGVQNQLVAQQGAQTELSPIPPAGDNVKPLYPDGTFAPHQAQQPYTPQPNQFVEWVKEDFFVKLGAFLLLLAFGWLASYAFANDWIGPAGRIFLGLILGAIFLGLGTWRIRTHLHQGGIFTVLGATTVLLTVFAARGLYDFFTPLSALILMFVTVVFVAFVSIRYNSQKLAIAGLVLGSIAPMFTAAPVPDVAGLFTYLLVIALGSLWVVFMTGWSKLTFVSMLITFLYSLVFLLDGIGSQENDVAVMFSFIFVSLFFIANTVSMVRRRGEGHMFAHVGTAVGSALFLFVWIAAAIEPEWQSLLFVAWSLVFGVGTYIVYMFTSNRAAFYLYGGTSVALIGAATAAELGGPVLTIAFLLEVGILIGAAAVMKAPTRLLTRLSWLFAVPLLLSLESLSSYSWKDGIIHADFVVVTLTALVLLLTGLFISTKVCNSEVDSESRVSHTLIVVGGVYVVAWVWLVFHALFEYDIATMFSLVVYTVSGISMFVYGRLHGHTITRVAGATLIALAVGRLMLVEVWNMDLGGRIVTFFVIGILLISTAFIKKDKSEVINNEEIQ